MVIAFPLAVIEKAIYFVVGIDDVIYLAGEDIQEEVRAATTYAREVPLECLESGIGKIRKLQDIFANGTKFVCRYDISGKGITNPGAVRKLSRGRRIIDLS